MDTAVKGKFNYMNILLILVFVLGLGILLYPNISNYFNERNSSKSIAEYDETIAQLNEETRTEYRESATTYNRELLGNPTGRFADMTDDVYERYMSEVNVNGDGMMCYLKIDKLGLNLPVYHGTTEEVLQKYVGHIEGTSLPVGGESTHCGLSGHRGLPSAVLFTNLDRLEVGDVFSILVLGQEHFYKIDQIVTVLPNDMSPLDIEEGKDYVTLVTCTPYGENTHRLMIRGARLPDEEVEEAIREQVEDKKGLTREQIVNIIATVMVAAFALIGIPLLIIPVVPKKVVYLRPWDDNLERVFQAAIKVSEFSTRANWETEDVTTEADRLAAYRRWDNTLTDPEKLAEDDEDRAWNEYTYTEDYDKMSKLEEDNYRAWDDEVLDKVDQDWSPFNRAKSKMGLLFTDIEEIFKRGKVEAPPKDLQPEFDKEIQTGEEINRKHKKFKKDNKN